jgi:hypothetical protein
MITFSTGHHSLKIGFDKGTLVELLTYFDSRDMSISRVYIESCLVVNDLPEELQGFAESIDYKEIQTFYDFLEL